MPARLVVSALALLASVALVRCGAPATSGIDAGDAVDSDASSLDPSDAGDAVDPVDAGESLVAHDDAGEPPADAGHDEGDPTVCVDPVGEVVGCDYLDLEWGLLLCDGEHRTWKRWADHARPECPAYFTLAGTRCDHLTAAATSAGCSTRCVWRPGISVSFVDCGRRNGYIEYRAVTPEGEPDPECPPALEFADGYYPSLEDWRDKHPCPDAPDAGE